MSTPQGPSSGEIVHRVGTFFLLVGIGLLIFFLLSETAQQVDFRYFCSSIILLILGFAFRGRLKRAGAPSGRFSLIRRFTPKAKREQGKKK